ncbi:unnamed protein product, partial [Candidula unifasciata]
HVISRNEAWLSKKHGSKSGLWVVANIRQENYGIVDDGTAGLRISFLPHPYKSFGSEYCTDADPDSPRLLPKMVNSTFYSFEKCQSQCVVYRASVECGCFIPELGNMEVSSLCDCPRPCRFVHYDTTLSSSQFPSRVTRDAIMKLFNITDPNDMTENLVEVQVYFDSPLVWTERHEPEFTIHSFMGKLIVHKYRLGKQKALFTLIRRSNGHMPGSKPGHFAGVLGAHRENRCHFCETTKEVLPEPCSRNQRQFLRPLLCCSARNYYISLV